jgi:hypothetical protein
MNRLDLLKVVPKHTVGAELGVYVGEFSQHLLDIVDPTRLYLVDVWQYIQLSYADKLMSNDNKQYDRYVNVLKKYLNDDRVRIVRAKTDIVTNILDHNSLDWVYIDADHSYEGCNTDLRNCDQLVKNSGIIMGHDYGTDFPGVIKAVDDFVKEKEYFLTAVTNERCGTYLISKTKHTHDQILANIDQHGNQG